MTSLRERRRTVRGDAGFTLIELIVAAGLMSLIATLVATTVAAGIRTAARSERRTDDAARAQIALLQLNADLRAADNFTVAAPDKLSLTTRSRLGATGTPGSAVEAVTYELVGGGLQMTRGTSPARVVLPGVATPAAAGRPLFRFLAKQDLVAQCPTGPTVGTLGSTITGDLSAIYAVDVWLDVNSSPQVNPRPLVLSGGAVVASRVVKLGTVALTTAGSLGIGQGC